MTALKVSRAVIKDLQAQLREIDSALDAVGIPPGKTLERVGIAIKRATDLGASAPSPSLYASIEPLMLTEEVAQVLRKSPRTLEAWRASSVGPAFVRIEGQPLYRRSDLVAFIEANVHNAPKKIKPP